MHDAGATAGAGTSTPPGTSVSAVYLPFWTAALAVTTLNVEPGGSVVWTARLSSGWDLSASRAAWRRPTPS